MPKMNFYEITSLRGRFWITAERAADAFRTARAILQDDEFKLERCDDVRFAADA
jgi:hypothetical protein